MFMSLRAAAWMELSRSMVKDGEGAESGRAEEEGPEVGQGGRADIH